MTREPSARQTAARPLWRKLLVPALVGVLLLGVAGWLVGTWSSNEAGIDQYEQGWYTGASDHFREQQDVVVQSWVGPFNLGTVHHQVGEYAKSEERFRLALTRAPRAQRCMISLNLAWTLETQGDVYADSGNWSGAKTSWQAAKQALASSGCESGSDDEQTSQTDTNDRLDQKLTQQPETGQGEGTSTDPSASPTPRPSTSADSKASQLEERNRSANVENMEDNRSGYPTYYPESPW